MLNSTFNNNYHHQHFNSTFHSKNNSQIPNQQNKLIVNYHPVQNNMNKTSIHSQVPYIFQIPKFIENYNYIQKTPSPSPNSNNRMFMNSNDNMNRTLLTRSPVQYHNMNRNIFNNIIPQINSNNMIRHISPNPNLRVINNNININYDNTSNNNTNNLKFPLYQTSPPSINLEKKVHRLVRTPEPRRDYIINNINNFNNNNSIKKTNLNSNINNNTNISNLNLRNSNNSNSSLSSYKNEQTQKLIINNNKNNTNPNRHIVYLFNNTLKNQKNINLKPINKYNQNNNYDNNSSINKNLNIYYDSTKNNPNLNYNSNQNIPPNIQHNHINIIQVPKNIFYYNYGEKGSIKRNIRELTITKPVPNDNFNPHEFQIVKQIGKGSSGKIYCIKWIRNNELYALKKINLFNDVEKNMIQQKVKIVKNFISITGHNGLTKIYGDKCIPYIRPNEYHYYIIMELIEKDWESELKNRKTYYSENEILQIISQLVKTLSLMQKNNITHRDIKPQNILVNKGTYKICDYDDIKKVESSWPILHAVRGSELYMSPILFYAYNNHRPTVLHNSYKSDVFSLGMCILLACTLSSQTLYDIRELKDMNHISQIITRDLICRYSQRIINLIIKMLQIDENLRVDFIELEQYISRIYSN